MKVLVIGNGGREHALAGKRLSRRWLIPSTSRRATPVPPWGSGCKTSPSASRYSRCWLAQDENIDLTIVGPEAPLVVAWSTRSVPPV